MFPEEEVKVLDMTVEEAFKAIMSSGIVSPARGGVLSGLDPAAVTQNIELMAQTSADLGAVSGEDEA